MVPARTYGAALLLLTRRMIVTRSFCPDFIENGRNRFALQNYEVLQGEEMDSGLKKLGDRTPFNPIEGCD